MPIILRLALLIDISSIWCDTCFPQLSGVWPFSLDPRTRMTILLLGSVIALEAFEITRQVASRLKHPLAKEGGKAED